MSPNEAKEIIATGESLRIEFKAELSSKRPEQICKEVAALASMQGGYLFIGVEDNGAICGVVNPRTLQSQIENWVTHVIKPVPTVDVCVLGIDGTDVVCVEINSGDAPIYYVKGRPYFRVGTSSVPASPEDVERLIRNSHVSLELRRQAAALVSVTNDLNSGGFVAAGILGQCELATMSYDELLVRLIDDLKRTFVLQ